MHSLGRTRFRTHIYLIILVYLGLLVVGGALDFLLTELGMGQLLSGDVARTVEAARMQAVALLAPPARFVFRIWPEAAGAMVAWPLVSIGFTAAVVSFSFFSACDVLCSLKRK